MGLLGQGDYGGELEAGWDSRLCQGLIEDPSEDLSQLVCTLPQHMTRDAVRTSRLLEVGSPQDAPDLMFLQSEDGAVGCMVLPCLRCRDLKEGEEDAQLLCQCMVTCSKMKNADSRFWGEGCERYKSTCSTAKVGPVVCQMLDALPHLPAVITLQVVFNPPAVVHLGLPDNSIQVSSGPAIMVPITGPEGDVPLL